MAQDIQHGIFNGAGVRQQYKGKPISFTSVAAALRFIKDIREQDLIATEDFLCVGEIN